MSESDQTLAVLRQVFAAFAAHDLRAFRDLLHPDVVLQVGGGPATLTGADAVVAAVSVTTQAIPDLRVTGATLDSRQVAPGDLYAALPGFHRHGADFSEPAVRAGAVAVLTDSAGADAARVAGVRRRRWAVPAAVGPGSARAGPT